MSINRVPTQIEAQRSGFDLERRKHGASELSTLGGSERYEVASDEGKQSLRPTLSVAGSRQGRQYGQKPKPTFSQQEEP